MTEMINPLWMTNYDNAADLLYDNLPCHNNSSHRWENWEIEKSAASDAYIPSFPTIPIPTSASWIIATSFPPSPTEAVQRLVNCFIFLTIIAF